MTTKHPRPVVANGGTSEYIYGGSKSEMGAKRSINDRPGAAPMVCRLTITPHAAHILDQLSVVMGLPKGQVADAAIVALGIVYNQAAMILEARPDLAALLETLVTEEAVRAHRGQEVRGDTTV